MLLIEDDVSDFSPARWKYNRLNFAPVSADWTESASPESKIHRIHAYPARFPAFLVQRSIDYAQAEGVHVGRVGDIFCGSGTVAYEAASRNYSFWGCDINPVATMIAQVKAKHRDPEEFLRIAAEIVERCDRSSTRPSLSETALERLVPWFEASQFEELGKLRNAIAQVVGDDDDTALAFECAFSAILKPVSRWKSRSTKPAKDPSKVPVAVLEAFKRQCRTMAEAWAEAGAAHPPEAEIVRANIADVARPVVPIDLIVTSPPYALSYEYADLHQLSMLWLGFADDHRVLRADVIGTNTRRTDLMSAVRMLNSVGIQVVFSLFERDKSLAGAAATYFLDMQKAVLRCFEFLRPRGISVFVVGNTQLQGIRIDNANHLVESLLESGFVNVRVVKRQLSNKPNTPYRLSNGRLSASPTPMRIYAEEYIVMAQRP
ncbi:hypothetical protein EN851_28250 [Mesorhizobium sp. M8A.F.Ca.ET.208.01.1.1]|uniref:site-specific DNA-methyltransferase n=1 Tax=unclassified Mesorhizobium TaxID=325217 RepID=UPI000FD26E87|nr:MULTISPECIES: site-specific DNA-methyltransferase [unclassified Mesorhizobium]RUX04164.1 hypothetical protein EOA35_10780 [Mesorhizobium sp. M8A.F.Ca.ET.023.01.1.1]RWC72083.1 MAG: hypothetical protein EOS71_22045 [Mesorhizobium sp.]TGQ87105.1 hypothetical protein EN851_28250 [Mesorhizobium sp. M8A.F.Ca.ET.208.01.1.1]TGT49215.1 hypothetical protein EN810_28150 [Mesorhizobium sp. M8A.F.Ca.ET.167.01.1.1]